MECTRTSVRMLAVSVDTDARSSTTDGSDDEWFAREDLLNDFPEQVALYEQSLRRI